VKRNFDYRPIHYDHPEISSYKKKIEEFLYPVKIKTWLMKGFLKKDNTTKTTDTYLALLEISFICLLRVFWLKGAITV